MSVLVSVLDQVAPVPNVGLEDLGQHLRRGQPVVVRGGAAHWTACRNWNLNRLAARLPDWPVTVMEVSTPAGTLNARKCRMAFGDFVAHITRPHPHPLLYLQQQRLDRCPEAIRADMGAWPIPPCSTRCGEYFWVGPAGVTSPLHYDAEENIFCQIAGLKRFVLFAPEEEGHMHAAVGSGTPHLSLLDMADTSAVAASEVRHAKAMACVISGGDLLYLPPRWWHQVHCYTASISANIWYR